MPSNLTKSAVLIAMQIAADEGDTAAWHALDRLYASLIVGDTPTLAASMARVNRLDPYQLDHGDPGEGEATFSRPDDGRRA